MAKGIANIDGERADGLHCVVCGDRLTGKQQVRCRRHAYAENGKEPWKQQWKKQWRQRPDVKVRQRHHQESYMQLMAHAHGVTLKAFKKLSGISNITQASECLIEPIRIHELRALTRRKQPTSSYRHRHPLLRVTCKTCGNFKYVAYAKHATPWCKSCKKQGYEHERRLNGKHQSPQRRATKTRNEKKRYASDEMRRLNKCIQSAIRRSPTSKHFRRLGYSYADLQQHIKESTPDGMRLEEMQVSSTIAIKECKSECQVYERWALHNLTVKPVSRLDSERKARGIEVKELATMTCIGCDTVFSRRIIRSPYCSQVCRQRHKRQKQRDKEGRVRWQRRK